MAIETGKGLFGEDATSPSVSSCFKSDACAWSTLEWRAITVDRCSSTRGPVSEHVVEATRDVLSTMQILMNQTISCVQAQLSQLQHACCGIAMLLRPRHKVGPLFADGGCIRVASFYRGQLRLQSNGSKKRAQTWQPLRNPSIRFMRHGLGLEGSDHTEYYLTLSSAPQIWANVALTKCQKSINFQT